MPQRGRSSCCTDLRFVCSVVFVCVRRRVVHCDVGVFIGGCKLILNARWCGFEQVRLSVAFSRGCAATRVTFVSMCRKQACVSVERASTHMALDGQVAWLGALLGCFGRALQLYSNRLGWPRKPPWVGQSFLANIFVNS